MLFTGAQRLARQLRGMGLSSACLLEKGERVSNAGDVDHWIEYDPSDLSALKRWATHWPQRHRIAAVLNRRERRVLEHALLNQALGMPGLRPHQARVFRDKLLLRRLLEERAPHLNPTFEEVALEQEGTPPLPFPFLLKPRNLFKSQLIVACRSMREWESGLKRIREGWKPAQKRHGVRLESSLLAEEEIQGSHFSVDALVTPKGHLLFSPPVYLTTAMEWGIEDFHVAVRWVPAGLEREKIGLMEQAVADLVEAMELRASPLHVDLVMQGQRVWVLDAAPRVGGYRSEMMELAWGCSLDIMSLRLALGDEVRWEPRWERSVAVVELFPPGSGILEAIHGLEQVRRLGSFHRLRQRVALGEGVGLAREGFRCPIFVVMVNPEADALRRDVESLRGFIGMEVSSP